MPLPTLPIVSDFEEVLSPVLYLPANNKPTNAVIFLHGLGDNSNNFSNFAKALNLPQAVTITFQAPFPLPFPIGPGYQWSDDPQFDTSAGTLDSDSPLVKATNIIVDAIVNVLMKKCHFSPGAIHLFGFGQGGSLALSIPLHESMTKLPALGGVISIGGPLPLSADHAINTKSRTPICLLGGRKGAFMKDSQSPIKRLKTLYEIVEFHEWKKVADSMPKNREEALPMMQFFGRRLRDRRGIPDDFVEIGS